MPLDLYYTDMSPDNHSILMVLHLLEIDVNKKLIDVRTGEHKTPEFSKINPQHSLPTIVDDGFVLWESRAILMYLATKYDKTGKLYPGDLQERAEVDRQLFFNAATLQARFMAHYMVTVKSGLPIDPQRFRMVEEGVAFLDRDLEKKEFVTGRDLTIGDICNLATMYNYKAAGFAVSDYANVVRWMDKCATLGLKYPEEIMAILRVFFAPKK